MDRDQLYGTYTGRHKARAGREKELSPQERSRVKSGAQVELELRRDGTYVQQLTVGTWDFDGVKLTLTPTTFGGKSLAEMEAEAIANCRQFGLAFVFIPSHLRWIDDALCTGDDVDLVYMEFRNG